MIQKRLTGACCGIADAQPGLSAIAGRREIEPRSTFNQRNSSVRTLIPTGSLSGSTKPHRRQPLIRFAFVLSRLSPHSA